MDAKDHSHIMVQVLEQCLEISAVNPPFVWNVDNWTSIYFLLAPRPFRRPGERGKHSTMSVQERSMNLVDIILSADNKRAVVQPVFWMSTQRNGFIIGLCAV